MSHNELRRGHKKTPARSLNSNASGFRVGNVRAHSALDVGQETEAAESGFSIQPDERDRPMIRKRIAMDRGNARGLNKQSSEFLEPEYGSNLRRHSGPPSIRHGDGAQFDRRRSGQFHASNCDNLSAWFCSARIRCWPDRRSCRPRFSSRTVRARPQSAR